MPIEFGVWLSPHWVQGGDWLVAGQLYPYVRGTSSSYSWELLVWGVNTLIWYKEGGLVSRKQMLEGNYLLCPDFPSVASAPSKAECREGKVILATLGAQRQEGK